MQNLTPRRRTAALAASCAAIIPSVLLLSRNNGGANHAATFAGMAVGVVVGVSILLVRKRMGAC